jgi:hypothetical protein
MSKALDDAIEHLTTTYQSLAQAAVGYCEVLSAKEVNARLAKAIPDTAEYIALAQLSALLQASAEAATVETPPAAE